MFPTYACVYTCTHTCTHTQIQILRGLFLKTNMLTMNIGLPWWLSRKEPACQRRRRRFDLRVGKIPCRRKWQPSPVFFPGKSHGQRSLVGHSPAAAKSLQPCQTLCDPIDSSPPGSPVPGILQARALEWVAISSFNAWKWKVKVKLLSRVRLLATPWIAAYQAPPSMGFARQEYWSGVPSSNSIKNAI